MSIQHVTQNISLIVKCHGTTAYELLKGRKPNVSYFLVFGCICYILNKKDQRSKFEAKADEGFFMGYSCEAKALKILNLSSQVVKETINVTFY